MNNSSENKKIAKNSLLLYFRMGISMAIGLYTSRVILATLGAEDYGINNIVGGFVSMLSLFTVSLGNATSRFITYELGTGNKEKLKDTFSTISTLIIILSLIVFFFGGNRRSLVMQKVSDNTCRSLERCNILFSLLHNYIYRKSSCFTISISYICT